jgi:DNA-binding response OmpR family regulator
MIFRFGSYALDSERRELSRSGRRVALERQVFDILLYLLENRHRVVTREDVQPDHGGASGDRRQRRATAADPDRDA